MGKHRISAGNPINASVLVMRGVLIQRLLYDSAS